jgi:hypothetical protein
MARLSIAYRTRVVIAASRRLKDDLREWWVAVGALTIPRATRSGGQRRSMPEH